MKKLIYLLPFLFGIFACAPQIQPTPTSVDATSVAPTEEVFSSDELGICFSYPLGYTQNPYSDTVEILGPALPGSDRIGLFWLEKSDSQGRTAEKVADEELAIVPGLNVGRSTVTLGGEPALVLDGMPGQDLQRRVFIVRGQTLYILAFMPTRSENQAANDQMEALFTAVTNSWAWSPCSGTESPSIQNTNESMLFSSDQLGICFSYPQGYTEYPYNDTVEIAAADLPASGMKGLFWLEMSDAYGRSAEQIADEDLAMDPGLNVERWTVTLGGEPAIVLDGMSGQDLQRRVYIVRGQTLYILAFMPTRSENQAVNDQMEALFTAVTSSWAWSPCPASK